MCNEAYRQTQIDKLLREFSQTRLELVFPEGLPNFAPLDSIRITDRVEIIRPAPQEGAAEMVTRRWSWPMTSGKPVYNFRADGRTISHRQRCLIPVDGFFEFTPPPADAPKKTPKSKWAFTLKGADFFFIAGIWRVDAAVGEAWAMLTCPPGADITPYHSRQVVVIPLENAARWLDPSTTAAEMCKPLPEGSLAVARIR